MAPVKGETHPGGSSWQSLARGAGKTETDYLNGEIVMLGRLHGVPTPVNECFVRLAHELVRSGATPGSIDPTRVDRELGADDAGDGRISTNDARGDLPDVVDPVHESRGSLEPEARAQRNLAPGIGP